MTDVTLQLAMDYMDANFNNNISVDTVAEHVQRSSSYLSRIFKESTGMTVGDYLSQFRIKRAMELLTQPGLTIEEICSEIGYANVSYFNKIFKPGPGLPTGNTGSGRRPTSFLPRAGNRQKETPMEQESSSYAYLGLRRIFHAGRQLRRRPVRPVFARSNPHKLLEAAYKAGHIVIAYLLGNRF